MYFEFLLLLKTQDRNFQVIVNLRIKLQKLFRVLSRLGKARVLHFTSEVFGNIESDIV
jgi:hypothetical protein